jgi:nucleoside-diphosphate-sugar epimerase
MDLTATTVEAQYHDERKGDIKHSLADVSQAHRDFGFQPQYSFEDGLKETIEWFTTHL